MEEKTALEAEVPSGFGIVQTISIYIPTEILSNF